MSRYFDSQTYRYPTMLKQIMELRGIRYDEFADNLGIGRSTLYLYANGKRVPPVDIAIFMADILGLRLDNLRRLFEPC